MKKSKFAFYIFAIFIYIISLTGCAEKKPVSVDEFQNVMSNAGFTMTDVTGQASTDSITAIRLAMKDTYQIEFYIFTENKFAASAFMQNKSIFEGYKNGVSSEISKNIGNYDYYSLVSGGDCYILARVDNTLLYTVADAAYKKEITGLLEQLGY